MAQALRDGTGSWIPALRLTIFDLAFFPDQGCSALTKRVRGSNSVAEVWEWSGAVADRLAVLLRRSPALRPFVETLEADRVAAADAFRLNASADLLLTARRAATGLHLTGRGVALLAAVSAAAALADGLNIVEVTHWLSRIGD